MTKNSDAKSYSLDLSGFFSFDLSSYPLEYIQAVEVQLRYSAGDSNERWYLKAYN